ncbi:uncharacterized protein EI90DRAFT_3035916, partial [Cantharellus anzutake]|uniref:uncharacterized protein n=1 Tax=Cantharellus anzutake TaxID=1750568 RepID=UPI00190493E1
TCWLDGKTYELGYSDCLGVAGGSGSALAFISERQDTENDEDDVMEVLFVSEKREGNQIHYPLSGKENESTWRDPPVVEVGSHDGRPFPRNVKHSASDRKNPPPHPFWPSKIFHSLVMTMPNMMEPPFGYELGALTLLMSLSGRMSVSQIVLPPNACASPPTAHTRTIMYVAIEGEGRSWESGTTESFGEGQFLVVPGGTGILHCIFNEGDDDFIYLEIEYNGGEDKIFRFPGDDGAKREAIDSGEIWWDSAPQHQLGTESYIPSERHAISA